MQSQRLVIAQKQQLKLSPQMYQSLELMALPIIELREKIQQEIERNPALQLESGREISYDRIERAEGSGRIDPFENSSDPGYVRKAHDHDPDAKQKFLEGALSSPESLQEHLLGQLRLLRLDPEDRELGELLISNLDEHGFYRETPEALVPGDQRDRLESLTAKIREFDPPGICVENVIESLVLQARLSGDAPPGTEAVIRNHLEDLRRGRAEEAARVLNLDPEDVAESFQFIKNLNPYPGSGYTREATRYVVPDLLIRNVGGRLVLQLNADQIPTLHIDPDFEEMGGGSGVDRETERYIQQAIRDAKWLINSVEMRNSTLRRVGASLLKHQRDFFLKGPKYLRPLTLHDVAEEISVHETTVSRISNAKYIQTDWGILPIKYFFTNAVQGTGDDGKEVSKTGVKEIIREIVEGYAGKKRLSDQKISDLLSERGIKVARRTVAKYRGELNIDSSFDR